MILIILSISFLIFHFCRQPQGRRFVNRLGRTCNLQVRRLHVHAEVSAALDNIQLLCVNVWLVVSFCPLWPPVQFAVQFRAQDKISHDRHTVQQFTVQFELGGGVPPMLGVFHFSIRYVLEVLGF